MSVNTEILKKAATSANLPIDSFTIEDLNHYAKVHINETFKTRKASRSEIAEFHSVLMTKHLVKQVLDVNLNQAKHIIVEFND